MEMPISTAINDTTKDKGNQTLKKFKLYSQQAICKRSRDLSFICNPCKTIYGRAIRARVQKYCFPELACFMAVHNFSFHNQERGIGYLRPATPVPFQLEIRVNSASRIHRPQIKKL